MRKLQQNHKGNKDWDLDFIFSVLFLSFWHLLWLWLSRRCGRGAAQSEPQSSECVNVK